MGALVLLLLMVGFVLAILPIINLVRATGFARDLAALRQRVEQLERRGAAPPPAVEPVSPQPASPPAPLPIPVVAPTPVLEPAAAGAGAEAESEPASFEQRVGSRWLLYTGVLILLLGVSFFLKYAFDNEWIGPAGRVLSGATAGVVLIAAGSRVAGRRLRRFGLALSGAGFVVLYLSIYAALSFHGLIGSPAAFALCCAVTVAAVWQAHRTRDEALALIAIIGGYVTPFLVGGEGNAQVALFGYDLLLGAGVLALAARRRWFALPVVSFVFTVLTVGAWAGQWYTEGQWLTTLAFLTAFCALFVAMLRQTRKDGGAAARVVTLVLWSAPALYHAAALAVTWSHAPALQVYLIVTTAIGLLATTDPHRGWLRLLLLAAAYVPFLGYVSFAADPAALSTDVITAAALAVLHVSGLLDRSVRQGQRLATPDFLTTHVAGIGLFGILSQIVRPHHADWQGAIAAMLALAASGLWFFFDARDRTAAQNAAGLAFTLVALAVSVQFEGRLVVVGWGVEGAVAAWFGLRAANGGFRVGGLVLWAMAAARLNEGYLTTPEGFTAILNDRSLAALTLVVLAYVMARAWRAAGGVGGHALDRWCPDALHLAASMLTLQWIAGEATSYWAIRSALPQVHFYEQLTLSLGFAVYAAILVIAGLRLTLPSLRWIGMAVIGLTVVKVFVFDFSALGGIFRVLGFVVVGLILVAVSYLYQRRSAITGR